MKIQIFCLFFLVASFIYEITIASKSFETFVFGRFIKFFDKINFKPLYRMVFRLISNIPSNLVRKIANSHTFFNLNRPKTYMKGC